MEVTAAKQTVKSIVRFTIVFGLILYFTTLPELVKNIVGIIIFIVVCILMAIYLIQCIYQDHKDMNRWKS